MTEKSAKIVVFFVTIMPFALFHFFLGLKFTGAIVLGVIWLIFYLKILHESEKSKANEAESKRLNGNYESSLRALENDPGNSKLRMRALKAGREKAAFFRAKDSEDGIGAVTVYDESAIKNDIDAVSFSNPHGKVSSSISSEIKKLYEIKDEGLIDEKDFNKIKGRITGDSDQVDKAITLLRGLSDLHRDGALTDGEFQIKKWEILSKRLIR